MQLLFDVQSNLHFYHSPDEGNEPPHTTTGNTWHPLTPNKADSTLQKGNGPCGTKTHMVAPRIHILVFLAKFHHSKQLSVRQEVWMYISTINQVKQGTAFKLSMGYKNYHKIKSHSETLNAAMKKCPVTFYSLAETQFRIQQGRPLKSLAQSLLAAALPFISPFTQSKHIYPRG